MVNLKLLISIKVMKKILSLLIVTLFSLTAFSQKTEYKIKIKIDGMQDSTCFLINYFGNQRYYKDTAKFNTSGVIIFEGKEALPGGIYTLYTGKKVLFEFLVNEPYIELATDTVDPIGHMKVQKSEENKLFFEHMTFVSEMQKSTQVLRDKLKDEKISDKEKQEITSKLAAVGKEINIYRLGVIEKYPTSLNAVIYRTMKEPESPDFSEEKNDSTVRILKYNYLKDHFFDDVDFSDSRINNTPLYHNKLEKYFDKIAYPHPDSINKDVDFVINKAKANDDIFKYSVHYLINKYEKSKIMGMDAVFSHIALNFYTHDLAFWVDSAQVEKVQDRARKLEPLLIGKQAINLSLLDTSGKKWINMHRDLKTDYTILVFWDPNCGHCKKELPKLAEYFETIKDKSVSVYSVSSKQDAEWKQFIIDNKLNFDNVAVPQAVYEDQQKATEYILKGLTDLKSLNYNTTYDIFTTPQIYLLDKDKKIIGKKLDTELLKNVMDHQFSLKK
jgi:peroxiredoxin